MDSLVEGLMKQMISGDNLSLLSNKVGADEKSTKSALEMGLPLLLGAMSNKASKSDGSNAIMSSLSNIIRYTEINRWLVPWSYGRYWMAKMRKRLLECLRNSTATKQQIEKYPRHGGRELGLSNFV